MRTTFAPHVAGRVLGPALLLALAAACTAARGPVTGSAQSTRYSNDDAPLVPLPVESSQLPRGACAALALPSSDRESDYLRPPELRAMPMPDLATLLQHRRPLWLSARPTSIRAMQPIVVYLNGARLGGAEVLTTIPVRDVHIARHVRPTAAVQKYGTGHSGGVIELYTKC